MMKNLLFLITLICLFTVVECRKRLSGDQCANCGPRPTPSNVKCADGTTEGPTGTCTISPTNGQCTWDIHHCPTPKPTPRPTPAPTAVPSPFITQPPIIRCITDQNCPAFSLCRKSSCNANNGVCWNRDVACSNVSSPVCGCDGKTYPNQCTANRLGVNVDPSIPGACPTTPPPTTAAPPPHCTPNDCSISSPIPLTYCPDNVHLQGFTGNCLFNNLTGGCYPEILHCPTCSLTQCGPKIEIPNVKCSDNKTIAGPTGRCIFSPCTGCHWEVIQCPPTIGDKSGPTCERVCECDKECPNNYFCKKSCCNSQYGCCAQVPTNCDEKYDPVCDCYGKTFPNPCWAYRNGRNIAHAGVCEDDCYP